MINHLTQIGRTGGPQGVSQPNQDAALAKGQERLSGLSNGDTIQGKVVSVSEGANGTRTAQVDLGDGAVINAKLSGNMALSAGQDISFSVKSQAGGGQALTLRPLYANTAADLSAMKALSQAGLPANTDMTAMVREMMSEGMSVDRGSLLAMTRNVAAYPGHATSVVQMTNLGIPINDENITQFENYKNFEHQVMGSIDSIMDELPEAFNAMNESGNNAGALDLYGELLELFGAEEETAPEGVLENEADSAAVNEGAEEGEAVQTKAATPENAANPENINVSGDGRAETISRGAEGKISEAPEKDPASALMEALKNRIGEENARAGESAVKSAPGGASSDVLEAAMKALSDAGSETASAGGRQAGFAELLKELNIPQELINKAQSGEASQTELLRALSEEFKKTAHSDEKTDRTWTKLFSTKEMGGILKEAVAKDWLLKPSDVEKKDNVKNLYERLQNQTNRLAQILSDTKGTQTALSEGVQNLKNNLNFMNDLNHVFQFVQLPLKMSGQNTHGDLYVYANKKNAMHEDGTVSAVLHLDMEHMGPVDVFVKMRDNNVKTNFFLADDGVIDLIMEHIDMLNERLEKRGYNMETKLQLKGEDMEEDAPVKEMLSGNLSRMSMLSQTSFDALA